MAKVWIYFGSVTNMHPVKENLGDGLKDILSTSAKVQLVSEPETTQLLGELTTRYGEIFLTLISKVQAVHSLKIDIDIANDFYEQSQAEVSRTLSEIRQINESGRPDPVRYRSEEHTSELQSLMRISYAVFCLKKKKQIQQTKTSKHAIQ